VEILLFDLDDYGQLHFKLNRWMVFTMMFDNHVIHLKEDHARGLELGNAV